MPRTFEQALRPPFEKPDASYMADILCDTCAQRIEAEANTLKVQICGSRKAELFYNESVGISPEDRGRIESVLGRNFDEKPETRSLWLPLNEPIDACNLPFGKGISCIQIKGVVFDASNSPTSYGGVGWPREAFFADRSGILQRHASANDDAMGRCSTEEAVNEYLMCARTAQYFEPEGIYVPFPVGWGTFQVPGDTKDDFGFVILGLPDLIPGREAVYLNAAEELQNTHDFSRMGRLLCLRSDAMRTANKNGFVVPYRHFGNISLTTDNGLFMHDMGTQHSLFEESFSSRRQFVAEAFAHLAYAITPRKLVVPVPEKNSAARQVAIDFLDQYVNASLTSYYADDERASEIGFEDFEKTFFMSFKTPLHKIDTLSAKVHCNVFETWGRTRYAAESLVIK